MPDRFNKITTTIAISIVNKVLNYSFIIYLYYINVVLMEQRYLELLKVINRKLS